MKPGAVDMCKSEVPDEKLEFLYGFEGANDTPCILRPSIELPPRRLMALEYGRYS
jgi:hypothetical protein